MVTINQLVEHIMETRPSRRRMLVALVGPPGAGKSTVAEALSDEINAAAATDRTTVVPMDGFHLDDQLLSQRNLLARKGAPETFDVAGFRVLLQRLCSEQEVIFPVFDRELEIARAGAAVIDERHDIIIVEGNYLLLRDPPWDSLHELWDLSIMLDVSLATVEQRILARWRGYGFDPQVARDKAENNDLPNARRVLARSRPADRLLINE